MIINNNYNLCYGFSPCASYTASTTTAPDNHDVAIMKYLDDDKHLDNTYQFYNADDDVMLYAVDFLNGSESGWRYYKTVDDSPLVKISFVDFKMELHKKNNGAYLYKPYRYIEVNPFNNMKLLKREVFEDNSEIREYQSNITGITYTVETSGETDDYKIIDTHHSDDDKLNIFNFFY